MCREPANDYTRRLTITILLGYFTSPLLQYIFNRRIRILLEVHGGRAVSRPRGAVLKTSVYIAFVLNFMETLTYTGTRTS